MILGLITFLAGASISAVAIYYSVIGLQAIFAADLAPIIILGYSIAPIILMGTVLELAKLVAAWWLKWNWDRAANWIKLYLTGSVLALMLITSMGIFGYLSKAHGDQNMVTGNNDLQIALIDTRIDREQKRIANANTVIGQLDEAVQTLIDFDRVRGKTGAIATRENQKEERAMLDATVTEAQDKIAGMQEEKLTLSQTKLALEAKVGPLKYIADLIPGYEMDLERAVSVVILVIIFVFDPLAILLLLSAQMSWRWWLEDRAAKKPKVKLDEFGLAEAQNVPPMPEVRPAKSEDWDKDITPTPVVDPALKKKVS